MLKRIKQELTRPTKKFRKLTDTEKDDIHDALIRFRNTFICGATFEAIRDIINLSFEEHVSPSYSFSIFTDSVNVGLSLSSFGLVDSVAKILLKPNLNSYKQWIPWTISTSVLSTLASRMIYVPLINKYNNGNISMKGYFTGLDDAVLHSSGFNVSTGIACNVLPDKDMMGGEFARSTAAITAGSFGATLVNAPLLAYKCEIAFPTILRNFWNQIPNIMLDNALFTIVTKVTAPVLK